MALLVKAILGAGVVVLLGLLARTKSFFIAGMVPLFPTFALIAHYIVGRERSAADLRTTALFGMWSLLPYLAYLAVVYVLSVKTTLWTTLGAATAAWLVTAAILLLVWTRVRT